MAGRDFGAELFGGASASPARVGAGGGRDFGSELFGGQPQAEPTESGGFFGSFKEALGERVETAVPAAQLFTGVGSQEEATKKLLQARAAQTYKQTEFSEIGDAFRSGEYGLALGKTLDKFLEVAGSSTGSQAPAAAAGLGVGAITGPVGGLAAYGLVALGSYISDNISRQKEEQAKRGKEAEDINRLTATTAAAGQTALDIFGFKLFKPLGRLVGIEGREASEKAALELVQAATNPNAYSKAVARGTATGIAFEVPQEVTQQALERWQAGLALNPFKDPEAAKEYLEAAGGALLLGGPMGAASRTYQTYKARQTPEGEALLRTKSPEWVREELEKEPQDVTKSGPDAGGRGVQLSLQPTDELPATGGPQAPQRGGVDVAGPPVAGPAEGERVAPPSVTPQQIDDFTRQYSDLRAEYQELASERNPTDVTMNRMKQVTKDLSDVIDANASWLGSQEQLDQFKNPMFDGTRAISALADKGMRTPAAPAPAPAQAASPTQGYLAAIEQAKTANSLNNILRVAGRDTQVTQVQLDDLKTKVEAKRGQLGDAKASQGEMFGKPKTVLQRANLMLAQAGRDVQKAISLLEERKTRLQERLKNGEFDQTWAIGVARRYGMTPGEAVKNVQQLAERFVAEETALADGVITQLRSPQPKAMQGDLFGQEKKAPAPKVEKVKELSKLDELTGLDEIIDESTLTEEDVAEQEALRKAVKEKIAAPAVSTEHIAQTDEGKTIKSFFDAIRPVSDTASETEKHGALKKVGSDLMLEFDIVKPGETTSPGIQAMLNYLARRVGGMSKFNQLLEQLQEGKISQDSLFARAGLPDLTSRRGLEEFNKQVKSFINSVGAKGLTVQVPAGKTPYVSDATTVRTTTQEFPAMAEGKPRRPGTVQEERKYKIADPKLRAAWNFLKQTIAARGKLTPGMLAAKNYMENPNRKSFGDVLADLAFDIANFEAFPDQFGANSTFFGEGGKYATDFKEWIEQNLGADTVDVLNNMVDDFRYNIEQNQKYDAAVTKYQAELKAYAETRRQKAEKTSGVKIPKSPEQLEREREAKIERNLPRVVMLPEVHPAIVRLLEEGKVDTALELLADAKGNKYYSALAQRLLDAGITAKSRIIGTDELSSLSNDPKVKETLDNQLKTLSEMLLAADPKSELAQDLTSNKLRTVRDALAELQGKGPEAQQQLVQDTVDFLINQFNWHGKYDPQNDEIVLRQGALSNKLFLHEALHAATLGLIDNPDKLQGINKQGYDQLLKLYNYSKGILSQEEFSSELRGLDDLHEFVSYALTDPEFQALLRTIRYQTAPFSLWNAFTKAVGKLFGVSENSAESNVMVEVMKATDAMMANSGMSGLDRMTGKGEAKPTRAPRAPRATPPGMRNQPTAIRRLMTSSSWGQAKGNFPVAYASAKSSVRPAMLGALTLRQIGDLVNNRIPQINRFIETTEKFLARKNAILQESGEISRAWEKMQSKNPDMSRAMAKVMHAATLAEFDPDPLVASTPAQRATNAALINEFNALSPDAKRIYRQVRGFYDKRYSEYKRLMNQRIIQMRQLGVSNQTILEIRNEFEQGRRKGPYFPLMRHGRFWYQIGKGNSREYYMFETQGQKENHMKEREARDPSTFTNLLEGSEYKTQMNEHARESNLLKSAFDAIDSANVANPNVRQELKDTLYQTFLANQPEQSFRKKFMPRSGIAGYSEDALRNFSSSSFHMAYQLSRFEHSTNLFSALDAAREQLKGRAPTSGVDVSLVREKNELSDYITEVGRRLELMLDPTDVGTIPSTLSNIGFIWYLSAPASAITNVLGGMIIGLPTLIGQYVKNNPNVGYTMATLRMLGQMKTVAGEIIGTGFSLDKSGRFPTLNLPSLDRANLQGAEAAAYRKFVADGIIDITATYDLSGLSASPTEDYTGARHRLMQALTYLFHNAERFNREIMAMSSFRTAMDKRKNYANQQQAFAESIAEAKDVTQRAMFDYSTPNKPRYFQHPIARVVLQFKQFPQQMTFFLTHNFVNMFKGASPEVRREARARFVGTMGMAGIFSGVTGLWGFSTVASIVNAVINGLSDEEEPFDFEIEFANWAVETFGKNIGTMLARGVGNAAGLDIASRTKLDDMWFRDGRKNQDEVEALQAFLVELLGPTVGLGINVAEAVKLYNTGHADRAIEMVSPAFIKNPLVAARYDREGVNTLRGDPLMEEMGPFHLLMQSLGLRSAELAERQFYNITKKGFEQEVLKKRQNLLDLYGVAFMAGDFDSVESAMEKIDKFNEKHPSAYIPMRSINKSIKNRLDKSSQTDHGLFIDKRMRGVLDQYGYMEE